MIAYFAVTAALADDGRCELIGFSDVTDVEAPAVIVLGERHGTQPDLARAGRVVRALADRAPVTLALEAVHEQYQSVLDDYAAGNLETDALPERLSWEHSWGFPWRPYEPLVTAARHDVKVVAAGTDLGPAPAGREYPVPAGYMTILGDAMAGHEVPPEQQERFVRSMAWRDFRLAENAVGGWDGEGYLVVVVGRGHVEGGKGTPWQLAQLTDKPVHAFVLAWAEPPCYPGDKVWKKGIFG